MKGIFLMISCILLLAGCMTKKQYKLEMADLKRASAHQAFFEIKIKGPLNIPEGGELIIPYPNQPFVPYPVTNDAKNIQAVITNGINAAAITGTVIYGIHKSGSRVKNTTINNAPAQ